MIDMPSEAAIVEVLKPCGLRAGDVSVRYDEVLQSFVVTVKRGKKVDAQNFVCLRFMLFAKADLEFEDEALGKLYRGFSDEVAKAESRAVAKAWLAQHELLDKLPTITSGKSASELIDEIEKFCELTAGAALEERLPGMLTFKSSFLGFPSKRGADCLLYTLMALDLERMGLRFGFIGNEAIAEEKK